MEAKLTYWQLMVTEERQTSMTRTDDTVYCHVNHLSFTESLSPTLENTSVTASQLCSWPCSTMVTSDFNKSPQTNCNQSTQVRKDRPLLCLSSGLHPSEEHLKAVPVWRLLQMLLLLHLLGGCTATILRGLTYPKVLCMPEKKKERKRENGDIAWRRSSPPWAYVAEIVTWG